MELDFWLWLGRSVRSIISKPSKVLKPSKSWGSLPVDAPLHSGPPPLSARHGSRSLLHHRVNCDCCPDGEPAISNFYVNSSSSQPWPVTVVFEPELERILINCNRRFRHWPYADRDVLVPVPLTRTLPRLPRIRDLLESQIQSPGTLGRKSTRLLRPPPARSRRWLTGQPHLEGRDMYYNR